MRCYLLVRINDVEDAVAPVNDVVSVRALMCVFVVIKCAFTWVRGHILINMSILANNRHDCCGACILIIPGILSVETIHSYRIVLSAQASNPCDQMVPNSDFIAQTPLPDL